MHGVPAFRGFGAPGREKLCTVPSYTRGQLTVDPFQDHHALGHAFDLVLQRIEEQPVFRCSKAPSARTRVPEHSTLSSFAVSGSKRPPPNAAVPGRSSSPGSCRSLTCFGSPRCPAFRGHQAVLRNPTPAGHVEHTQERAVWLWNGSADAVEGLELAPH